MLRNCCQTLAGRSAVEDFTRMNILNIFIFNCVVLSRFSTSETIGFFTPSVIDALVLMCASKNKQLKRQVGR